MSKFCTSCGTENINEAKFCRSCGMALEDTTNNANKQENNKPNIKKAKKEPKVAKEIDYSKIGGWLILYGVLLVFGILSSLVTVNGLTNQTVIDYIYASQNTSLINDYTVLIMLGMFHIFFISFVALNLFTKHPKTRIIIIIFSVVSLITTIFSIFLSLSLFGENNFDAEHLPKMIGSILWTIIWLLYFIFSKRVKKTFVDSKSNKESNRKMIVFVLIALILPVILIFSFNDKKDKYTSIDVPQSVSNTNMSMDMGIDNDTPSEASTKEYTSEDYYNLASSNFSKQNYSEALELYGKACNSGDIVGCNDIAFMYHNGDRYGLKTNYPEALELYKKACDGGIDSGCYGLGVMYESGLGVQRNYTKALEFYSKSCKIGSHHGCEGQRQLLQKKKSLQEEVSNTLQTISIIPVNRLWFGLLNVDSKERKHFSIDQAYILDIREKSWLLATSSAPFSIVWGEKTEKFSNEEEHYFKIDKNGIVILSKSEYVTQGGWPQW